MLSARSGREFRLGDRLRVRLVEADPVTGGTIFALANESGDESGGESNAAPRDGRFRPAGGGHPRRPNRFRRRG